MSLLNRLFGHNRKWSVKHTPMHDEGPGTLLAVRNTKRRILYINSNAPAETQAVMLENFKGDNSQTIAKEA